MSLITKPPSWGSCTTSYTGTPNAAGLGGITATAGTVANVDGSSVSLITNVGHDIEYLLIGYSNGNTAATEVNMLLDILVDPAGGSTWGAMIDDLLVGFSPTTAATAPPQWYHFPLWLKSGHSIGMQVKSNTVSEAITVCVVALGANANPGSWWCGQTVQSIGVITGSSAGTNHTPGSSGTFSAWADLGSSLNAPCGALQFAIQGADATSSGVGYYFEFGVGTSRIGPNIYKTITTSETGIATPSMPLFCSLPAATQLRVRATCSGVPETLDVAAYAVL